MNIPAGLDAVVAVLQGAGVSAAVDPRDLNTPCVWVTARSLPTAGRFMCGDRLMKVDLYLIAPDTGTPEAYRHLNDLLVKALSVLEPDGEIDLAETVTLPSGGGPLPAFRMSIEIEA